MIRCECHCVCCDTQVFLLPGMPTQPDLRCPSCGRVLHPVRLEPFDEQEWLKCHHPHVLVQHRSPRVTDRKRRLFLCACCRLRWAELTDRRSRNAVEVAERFADGLATRTELARASHEAKAARDEVTFPGAVDSVAALASGEDLNLDEAAMHRYLRQPRGWRDGTAICGLYRDIMGNPFRPLPELTPMVLAWGDRIVQRLAQGIHEENAYERLPILADALEEAGCTNTDVLEHCRGAGPHTRGCWVVDLLLAKQ